VGVEADSRPWWVQIIADESDEDGRRIPQQDMEMCPMGHDETASEFA